MIKFFQILNETLRWKTASGGAGNIIYVSESERPESKGIIKYACGSYGKDRWLATIRSPNSIINKNFDTLEEAMNFCQLADDTYPRWDKSGIYQ